MNRSEPIPVYDSARRGFPAFEELRNLFEYRYLVVQLVRRDLLTRYKRSVLGIAWTMLTPLGTMLVLTFAFSNAFKSELSASYPAYALSGLMAWTFFSQTTNAAILHLVWGGDLLKRIYVPRTVFAVSATGTGLVNLLLSMVPLIIIVMLTGLKIKPTVLILPIPILFLAMFALGLGLLISTIAIYFADVAEMYQVVLTAWMYLTPIIYPESILPAKYLVWIIRLNPMYHLVALFRAPLYDGRVPTTQEFLISGTIAVVTLVTGWVIFAKKSDEFAYLV